jgi:hypothetical protein
MISWLQVLNAPAKRSDVEREESQMKDYLRDSHLTALTDLATRKAIGRRRFMEGAIAAGLTVSAASALWSSRVEAAEPKKGGTFRVGMHDGNTTDDLDPGTTESVYMIQMNHAIRSYLTEITNTNEIGRAGCGGKLDRLGRCVGLDIQAVRRHELPQ